MPLFPKIQSPCPYKNDLAALMDGSVCRMCKREVHDLSGTSETERRAFLAACETEVCVSYKLPARAAAAIIAAAAFPLAAAADEPVDPAAQEAAIESELAHGELEYGSQPSSAHPVEAFDDERLEYVIVGGIKDPKNTKWIDDSDGADLPELPVIKKDQASGA